MAILSVNEDFTGEIGVIPRVVKIQTTDTFDQVTAANYLKKAQAMGYTFYPSDMILCSYGVNSGTSQWFTLNITSSTITMEPGSGEIDLPVTAGDFAVFSDDKGNLKDSNYVPTDPTKTKVVMANGEVTVNNIACFSDTAGTIEDNVPVAANGGSIHAGIPGTAGGSLASFSGTANVGGFYFTGVSNAGNFNVIIKNSSHGQSTTYSINDIGSANGWLLNCNHSTDTSPNLVTFNVTATAADLAAGGYKILYASSGIKQYRILNLYINYNASSFTGGGGNRLGVISDDITNYAALDAATMQNQQNIPWGTSGSDLQASPDTASSTLTVPGQPLKFKYLGGTTDYTGGSIIITGILERVV